MVNAIFTKRRGPALAAAVRSEVAGGIAIALLAGLLTGSATAQQGCPAGLARDLAAESPECRLAGEGRLTSALGNGDVDWRLYRWVSTREEVSALYDSAPYDQTAAALSPAGRPDDPPFWSGWYRLGVAWFETPYLATHPEYGEFLVVPGRYAGTGSFIEDRVFMADHGRGWTEVKAAGLDPESGEGWVEGLKPYLPPGHGIWKGIIVDYATLSGTTRVWRDNDANCCPSGGEIRFQLGVAGDPPALRVESAEFLPPEQ